MKYFMKYKKYENQGLLVIIEHERGDFFFSVLCLMYCCGRRSGEDIVFHCSVKSGAQLHHHYRETNHWMHVINAVAGEVK